MDAVGSRKSLADQTFDIILDAICTGELSPGERIAQDQIAEKLNVSRQPVNSAIAILKTYRLVEETGRRGVVVSPMDPALYSAISQFRAVVEPLAVRSAVPRLDDDARARGEAALKNGRAMLAEGNARGLLQADMDFHQLIYELSGNIVIVDSMRTNWHHLRRLMGELLRKPGQSESIWQEHAGILDAMFAGDAATASVRMSEHIARATDRFEGG